LIPKIYGATATSPREAKLVGGPHPGIAFSEHYVGDGDVYQQACNLGCEGIVSKRLGSAYRSGRSRQWVKVKNAVRREAEEDWARWRDRRARSIRR
jgi:bifunctional non-homologous end joining protein LigD